MFERKIYLLIFYYIFSVYCLRNFNIPGCGIRWCVFIGDSVIRETYFKTILYWKKQYSHIKIREIGEDLTSKKETTWRDLDTLFEDNHNNKQFKFSLRFVTSENQKLPSILKNMTMLHGGHYKLVEPLPHLAEKSPESPDIIFFSIGLWPMVHWIPTNESFQLKLEPVWDHVKKYIPKSKLIMFTLNKIREHPVIKLSHVEQLNQHIREFATNFSIPLIDIEKIAGDHTDSGFHLTSDGYELVMNRILQILCW